MPTSPRSHDESQHHSGDDHSAASTDQDQLRSDNVDNALEESRSDGIIMQGDANFLDQTKQEDTGHEASSNPDLVLREQTQQSAEEEVAAVASSLLTMAHTNADIEDDEASLASTRVDLSSLLMSLKEVKPGIETPNENDPESILSAVCAYLTESKKEISALSKVVPQLVEENNRRITKLVRMHENNKLLSSELRRLLRSLKEVGSEIATPNGDDPTVVFSSVRAYLTESKNKQSFLSEKLTLLEVENNKKSEDLGTTSAALEQAVSRASTAEDKLERYLQDYKEIQEVLETTKMNLGQANSKASSAKDKAYTHGLKFQKTKNKQKAAEDRPLEGDNVISKRKKAITAIEFSQEIDSSSITHNIRCLADEFKRTCEDLGSTKSDLRQANFRVDTAKKELEATKSKLEQANHKVSSAIDEANKRLLQMQNSLVDAERSLTSYRDKATQLGKVIDETEKVISLIKLPPEVVSMDIARKFKWLTDERKRISEELGSTTLNLERANFRADTAEKELEMSKLNLEEANLKADRELGAMKLNLEQAKSELNERCTELKAAKLEVKTMEEIKHAVSPIEFSTESLPMDTLTRVKCLADNYKNFISRSNQEGTKILLSNMKANIRRKIANELSEKVRVIVEAAVGEATDVEDPDPGASSSPAMAHASHPELASHHAGSDHNNDQEIGTSVTTHNQQQAPIQASGSAIAPQQNGSRASTNEQEATTVEQETQNDDSQSSSTVTDQIPTQARATSAASSNGSAASESPHVVRPPAILPQQQRTPHQPQRSVVTAPRAVGPRNGVSPQQHLMLYQQQRLPPQPQAFGPAYGHSPHHHQPVLIRAPGPAIAPPIFHPGFGPGYGFPHEQFGVDMSAAAYQQAFYDVVAPHFWYSPYPQQFWGGHDDYAPDDGSAGGANPQQGGRHGRGRGG